MGNNHTRDNQKWKDKNIERWTISFPKGKKEIVRDYAHSQGMTLTAYVFSLIENDSGIIIRKKNSE